MQLKEPQLLYRNNPDVEKLPYPVLMSPKLDGIRLPITAGGPRSRSMKLPGNPFITKNLTHDLLVGFDGEIIVGEPNAPDVFNKTDTFFKRHEMEVPFSYWVFDDWMAPGGYWDRYKHFRERISQLEQNNHFVKVHLLRHYWINNPDELMKEEERYIDDGYEGGIIRCPDGLYKQGRTTLKEMNAFKLKRFVDSEAEIIGFEEEMHNGNEAEVSEVGRTKRSTHAEGKTGKGTMGSLIVRDVQANDDAHRFHGVTFNIGTGFDAADRILFWEDRDKYYGKHVTYKYFAHGAKDAPRHPVYKNVRAPEDMLA